MKNAITLRILSLLFLCLCTISCQDQKSNEQDLMIALQKFNDAFQQGNTTVLSSMITDEYIHTNGNSKAIRKENWLTYLRKREQEIANGTLEIPFYEMDEIAIVFHDQTAIVTGRVKVATKRNNAIFNNSYRVTHLWIKEKGDWKRAGFHDTKIPSKKE